MERLIDEYVDDFGIRHYLINDKIQPIYYRSQRFDKEEQVYEKLAQFEKLMKKYGFEDISDIQNNLESKVEIVVDLAKCQKENQELKDRWQELKEFVMEKGYEPFKKGLFFEIEDDYKAVLLKMQELEKGE